MASNKEMRKGFDEIIAPFFEEGLPVIEERLEALEEAVHKIVARSESVDVDGSADIPEYAGEIEASKKDDTEDEYAKSNDKP